MLTINRKPFLYYQLKILEKFSFEEVVLCTGYLSNKISIYLKKSKFNFKIKVFEDGNDPLGTGGAIKKILNQLDTNFFVTYGDTILNINYNLVWKKFLKSQKKNMMCVKLNSNYFHKNNVSIVNNEIYYEKKQNPNMNMKYIDYGCSILNKNSFNLFKKKKFDLALVLNQLSIEKNLDYYITNKNFYEIGTIKAFNEFKRNIKTIYK